MNRPVMPVSSFSLNLPNTDGSLQTYRLAASRSFPAKLEGTLDRVEETSDIVHNTVVSPVRQFAGLIQGVTAGIEFLLGNRGRRNGGGEARRPVPQDEMFI